MKKFPLRSRISTSRILGSTLALGLSAVACNSSSDTPAADGAGGEGGARSAGGSSATGGSVGNGGATAGGSPGAGGTSAGAGGSGYAGSDNSVDSCIPETLTVPSNVPAIIETPHGATLIHHFHAAGTQNYKCTATEGAGDAGATYAWLFVAPEANLLDNCGNHVGTHYAGPGGAATPRWQYTGDGSFVQGMKVQASPVAGSIPELLLAATQTTAGAFADVTYVQRLATVGGAAPGAADCTTANVDEVQKSGYSAEYYFYAGGTDGGTH